MTTESLMKGLEEISNHEIPVDCIVDMAPEIIKHLELLTLQESIFNLSGHDYVYIAGKVSGLRRDDALLLFTQAEQKLHALGYHALNPMTLVPIGTSWGMAMRICITEMMRHCNKIYLLDNWTESEGAIIEAKLAESMHFTFIDSSTLKIAI